MPTSNVRIPSELTDDESDYDYETEFDGNFSNGNGLNTSSLQQPELGPQEVPHSSTIAPSTVPMSNKKRDEIQEVIFACTRGKYEQLRKILESDYKGKIDDFLNGSEETALLIASFHGQLEVIRYLVIEKLANVNLSHAGPKLTPIMVVACCYNQNEEVLVACASVLLDHGADLSVQDFYGFTPLMLAVKAGNAKVASLFIDRGADVNGEDLNERTALSVAAAAGSGPLCALLLERGANIHKVDRNAFTVVEVAHDSRYLGLADLLFQVQETTDPSKLAVLLDQIRTGKFERIPVAGVSSQNKEESSVESFLTVSMAERYVSVFKANGVTFSQLLQFEDSDLRELGVWEMGLRHRILDNIRKVHTSDWHRTSLRYLPRNKPMSSADVVCMLRDINLHLDRIRSTNRYMTGKVADLPIDLLSDLDKMRLADCVKYCEDMNNKSGCVGEACMMLQDVLDKLSVGPANVLKIAGQLKPYKFTKPRRLFSRMMNYLILGGAMAVVGVGICALYSAFRGSSKAT